MKVKIDEGAFKPERAHELDAGYDLRAREQSMVVPAGGSAVFNTGVHMEIPSGFAGFIKSKSGLNVNHDILSDGLVDSGYTGSIRVKLYNHGTEDYTVHRGDKISQIAILPVFTPDIEIVSELSETERGECGFGSTGR